MRPDMQLNDEPGVVIRIISPRILPNAL